MLGEGEAEDAVGSGRKGGIWEGEEREYEFSSYTGPDASDDSLNISL
jgi:hypothetical protein